MRIHAIVREVSRDDESMYAFNDDGTRRFMGRPLREFLALMDDDGFIVLPLPPGPVEPAVTTEHPELSLANSQVDPDVVLEVVDAATVRLSLDKWRGRDPESTFLMIGFQYTATDEAELQAMIRAYP